jgi:hypothetical protein
MSDIYEWNTCMTYKSDIYEWSENIFCGQTTWIVDENFLVGVYKGGKKVKGKFIMEATSIFKLRNFYGKPRVYSLVRIVFKT